MPVGSVFVCLKISCVYQITEFQWMWMRWEKKAVGSDNKVSAKYHVSLNHVVFRDYCVLFVPLQVVQTNHHMLRQNHSQTTSSLVFGSSNPSSFRHSSSIPHIFSINSSTPHIFSINSSISSLTQQKYLPYPLIVL